MNTKFSFFFLINFILAGSRFPTSSSTLLTAFNENIASGDIIALQSIIDKNLKYIKSPSAEWYRNRGLILAVQKRHASVVEMLLKHGNVNAATKDNEAFRLASTYGDVDNVKLLLARPEVDPTAMENEALLVAAKNGHTEIVRLLLENPKVDPSIAGRKAVILASSMNHADIIKLFINDGRALPAIFTIHTLEKAAQFGNVDLVKFLLNYPSFSQIVHLVVMNGDVTSINTIVEAGYKIDLDTLDFSLKFAKSRGFNEKVIYLNSIIFHTLNEIAASIYEKIVSGDLASLQVILDSNSKFINNQFAGRFRDRGFILAVQKKSTPIVELLLKKGNVNAAANNNEAIRLASASGDTGIVRILLNRPEVDPTVMENEALLAAAKNGYTEIVQLLLAHPKIDPSSIGGQAVFLASSMNHADIVKLFINDGRANSNIFKMYTLDRAAYFGNVDLVQFLLGYPYFSDLAHHLVIFCNDLIPVKTIIEAGYAINQDTLEWSLQYGRGRGLDDKVKYLESLRETPNLPIKPLIAMTEQCAICLSDENLFEGYMTNCKHQFHEKCLQEWISVHNSCPMCRSSII